MDLAGYLLLAVGVVVLYLLYKAFLLYNADGDLQVLGSKLKPAYFKERVVWVTGASSGSKKHGANWSFSAKFYVLRHVNLKSVLVSLASPLPLCWPARLSQYM